MAKTMHLATCEEIFDTFSFQISQGKHNAVTTEMLHFFSYTEGLFIYNLNSSGYFSSSITITYPTSKSSGCHEVERWKKVAW